MCLRFRCLNFFGDIAELAKMEEACENNQRAVFGRPPGGGYLMFCVTYEPRAGRAQEVVKIEAGRISPDVTFPHTFQTLYSKSWIEKEPD